MTSVLALSDGGVWPENYQRKLIIVLQGAGGRDNLLDATVRLIEKHIMLLTGASLYVHSYTRFIAHGRMGMRNGQ